MGVYNVKLTNYKNGYSETKIYSHPIERGFELDKKIDNRANDFNSERALISSLNRTKNKIYSIAMANEWDIFVTLTFNSDNVDRFDYCSCTKKLSKWLNNIRRQAPFLKYLIVPEMHKNGAWHFHGLLGNIDGLELEDSGHTGKENEVIFNLKNYKMGFTTATFIKDPLKVTRYIVKYITKDLVASVKYRKRYWVSRNVEVPEEYYYLFDDEEKTILSDELIEDSLVNYNCVTNKLRKTTQFYLSFDV